MLGAYDFSKAQTADIVSLRDRTQATLSANPNAANRADLQAYIDDANKELKARTTKKVLLYGALGIVGFMILKKR